MDMSFLCVDHLSAAYGKRPVLQDISFTVERGMLIGLLGANGSGKTTLLKAVCNILPHGGTCHLDNMLLERLSAKQIARLCSYIPQRSGITIDIPVLDVVLMGFNPHLGLLEYPGNKMKEKAVKALEQVGLAEYADVSYLHLSEGQKQLCILARTLVTESRLLLLDEPESALDFRYRYRMLDMLRKWSSNGGSGLIALHDPVLALNYCDRLLLLSDGKISGVMDPVCDPADKMEQMLKEIYGSVSLHRCRTHSGAVKLVMIKEDD